MMGNHMPQKSRNRKSVLAALCAAFGIALIVASGTVAFAGDDDDDPWDAKMIKKFLRGFGLRNGQEAGIEYQERPPLVLPRSTDLPAPAAANSPAANSPAWPSDPDEKRRAEERKAKKEGRGHRLDRMDTSAGGADGDPLKPSELAAGRTDKPAMKTTTMGDKSPELTPSELGWTNSMWSSMVGLGKSFTGEKVTETGTFVREPSREALTDPPAGYRTPSSAQPYGINSKADRDKARVPDRQTNTLQ